MERAEEGYGLDTEAVLSLVLRDPVFPFFSFLFPSFLLFLIFIFYFYVNSTANTGLKLKTQTSRVGMLC